MEDSLAAKAFECYVVQSIKTRIKTCNDADDGARN
ncbi:hypothetical protein AHiyo6_22690 [Arthrobacter sp. Hiyo6]|jgi:hypothetical protein|nr:hypothetical protein AHiyo6_22690 [Arthrobacter sp. Hiyo6]